MYIYSPVPPELIWYNTENCQSKLKEIKINSFILQVEPIKHNKARVVRVLSTDPADYLNNLYQPGTILNFSFPGRTHKK